MADNPPAASADRAYGPEPADAAPHPGMPRWVKLAIAVGVVLVLVLLVGKLAGVEHGPGLHGGSGDIPGSQVDAALLASAAHGAP